MNPIVYPLGSFILMFLLIILIVQLLKRRGVFNDSHQQVFDRLVTEFALPAIVFGLQSQEVALGQVIGSFGFALPFFTLGILAARYFRLAEKGEKISLPLFLKSIFSSPIFLAFWLGLIVSILFSTFHLPGADIYTDIFTDFFVVIQHAVNLLVWIAIGRLLRPVRLRLLVTVLALVSAIHLLILPALVFAGGAAAGLPVMQQSVAFIMAALPSGAIAAVVADRYGCDGKLTSAIVICTYLLSLVTLPLFLMLVPGL
jgi:predicted permease